MARKISETARKKMIEDEDLLDTPAAPTAQAATPSKLHGGIAMYNRRKGDPFPGQNPDNQWVLVRAGVPEFFVERKPCSKAFKAAVRGGAPAKRGNPGKRAAVDPTAPTTSTDPDVNRPSDTLDSAPVPSVWRTNESAMGLLVHVHNGTGKMITLLADGYTVSKVPVAALFSTRDSAMHDYRHQAAEWAKTHKDKDYPDNPGDRWWATTYAPRKFCDVAYKSSQVKSATALAFMAKVLAAPVELTEEDLLS